MTEIRTVSSTGGEKGVKPRTFHLLPWKALGVIAEHFGIGAQKYEDHNWRRGYEWSKSYSALQRHLADWWEGEDRDEDGLHNLAAAGFHVLVLITFAVVDRARYGGFDDRYTPEPSEPMTLDLVKVGYGSLTVSRNRAGYDEWWNPEGDVCYSLAEWAKEGWVPRD